MRSSPEKLPLPRLKRLEELNERPSLSARHFRTFAEINENQFLSK